MASLFETYLTVKQALQWLPQELHPVAWVTNIHDVDGEQLSSIGAMLTT